MLAIIGVPKKVASLTAQRLMVKFDETSPINNMASHSPKKNVKAEKKMLVLAWTFFKSVTRPISHAPIITGTYDNTAKNILIYNLQVKSVITISVALVKQI